MSLQPARHRKTLRRTAGALACWFLIASASVLSWTPAEARAGTPEDEVTQDVPSETKTRRRGGKTTGEADKPTRRAEKKARKLRARDAAYIIVRANFKTTTVTINDKPYPKNSPVGAIVAPNTNYEVVVTDTKSEATKRYKVRLKRGEAHVLVVDLSGGSASPITARAAGTPPTPATPDQPGDAAAADQSSGFLTVNATPNAQVYVDGKLVSSSTPLVKHTITPGNHTVRVYYVELKKFSETKRAMITEGRHINLYFNSEQK